MTPHVAIIGAGKVGRGLYATLRGERVRVTIVPSRSLSRPVRGDIVVLAVRDGALESLATTLAARNWIPSQAVVVHCAGALDAEVLSPLRPHTQGVAQMHPMMSFADPRRPPPLAGGNVHISGDPEAVRRARALCRAVGLVARTFDPLDRIAYHAAAGLVANGAATLAAAGADILVKAGVPRPIATQMIAPLLRSVADNIAALGLPEALTGPVRRGDAAAVAKHLVTLRALSPDFADLYCACAKAQLPLARALGDASRNAFDEIERLLNNEAECRL
ncbi:MAG: DUF2520 domain-containing protein [Polyangiales bacterium]